MLSPIFVVGNAKSGTTLLQSLLDNHPELLVFPWEMKFFKFVNLPSLPPGNMPPYPLPEWKTPIPRADISPDEIKHEILNHSDFADFIRNKRIQRNINLSDIDFDVEKFTAIIRERTFTSLKELFVGFFEAFYIAWKKTGDIDRYKFVEKTPTQEEYAQELKVWFPTAKFIHILRNPYANIYALSKKARVKRLRNYIYRPTAKSFYFMERNKRYIKDYFIVKYEDIVLSTEDTMHQVSDFLGIKFHKNLLIPTICGIPWQGNSLSTKGKFKGIDQRPLYAYKNKISALDIELVNRFFSCFLENYGYERIQSSMLKKWFPLKWETPISYMQNRALLYDRIL